MSVHRVEPISFWIAVGLVIVVGLMGEIPVWQSAPAPGVTETLYLYAPASLVAILLLVVSWAVGSRRNPRVPSREVAA